MKQTRFAPRRPRRNPLLRLGAPAYTFAAAFGLWLPQTHSEVLVDLDATTLPEGPLSTWPNRGTTAGDFTSAGTVVPQVRTIAFAKGVAFQGGTSGPDGTHYIGPGAPDIIAGGNPRTIEAWVYNPNSQQEETVFAWGRRGTVGGNVSFGHGVNGAFGALGHWGEPDMPWNNQIAFNQWTYIVYTYDGATGKAYKDGVEAHSEDMILDTWAWDDTPESKPLPFRVARQNEGNGTASGVGVGEITIAKIRVHNEALSAEAIQAKFNAEQSDFSLGDADNDGLPDWYERTYPFLNPNDASDAAKDQDSDGLPNLAEFQNQTLPNNNDTDGDGALDGAEVNRTAGGQPAPTNPLAADSDGDTLSDGVETGTGTFVSAANTGTDPLAIDTDADGATDDLEVLFNTDPTKANSIPAPRPALVNLDATRLTVGPLAQWQNTGFLGGSFQASTNTIAVQSVLGVKGVSFDGTNDFYTGPSTPFFITGNGSRTVEAWIMNPVAADEETIFSWGRRGGGDGSNTSFNHGLNATFGAVGHWGAPDVGWNGAVVQEQWTYVAYTYDGPSMTAVVYTDGVESAREEMLAPLNTWRLDTANAPLPFRVAAQNEANGTATPGLRGSMTIARLRVFDRAFSAEDIAAQYNQEKDFFLNPTTELEIESVSLNAARTAATITWTAAAGKTYSVEASSDLSNWSSVASGLTAGSFTENPLPASGARFYRLRSQ